MRLAGNEGELFSVLSVWTGEENSDIRRESESDEITNLWEVGRAARHALTSCMCTTGHPQTEHRQIIPPLSQAFRVPNLLHLVRSYKQEQLSFVEAACIRSYLLNQNPGWSIQLSSHCDVFSCRGCLFSHQSRRSERFRKILE